MGVSPIGKDGVPPSGRMGVLPSPHWEGWGYPPSGGWRYPGHGRQSKNITFRHPSDASSNKMRSISNYFLRPLSTIQTVFKLKQPDLKTINN